MLATRRPRLPRAGARIVLIASSIALACGLAHAADGDGVRNECLIAVQPENFRPVHAGRIVCDEGHPSCDADGTVDGTCTFRVRGCLDLPGIAGCEPRPIRRFSFNVPRIVVAPADPDAATSTCGAFVDLQVPLRKNGRKAGRRKVVSRATAKATPSGRSTDRDVVVFECQPASCFGVSCNPTTTTTRSTTTTRLPSTNATTTTTSSTLPLATCGNGVVEPGEACDGTAFESDPPPSCLHGGTMGCHDCKLDDSGCFACSNGRREGPEIGGSEQCDGNDIGTAMCTDGPGGPYHGGTPGCSANCQLEFGWAHCWRCGDSHLQGNEECDAGDGPTGNGTPQNNCDANCELRCGDGIVQQGEQCDDGGKANGDGCSQHCLFEGDATYAGGTTGDTCGALEPECVDGCYGVWGVAGIRSATATTSCVDGAACDADGEIDGACTLQYSYCLMTADTLGPGGTAPCELRDVKRVALVTPTDLDATARDAFLDSVEGALGRFDGVTVRDDDGVARTTSILRGDVCGGARVTIQAGASRVLAVAITDSGDPRDSGTNPRTDHDELVLGCLPAS